MADEFVKDDSSIGEIFKRNLRQWAIKFHITLVALSALLLLLQPVVNFSLPLDARTLLGTVRQVNISEIGGGEYYHFGLKRAIKAILREYRKKGKEVKDVKLMCNIDGLPIFKSTKKGLWLILCSEINGEGVYPVGAYFGSTKPNDANEFLKEFVDEMVDLSENGL